MPLAFPVIESFPRAALWTEWTYEPAHNPTAGLVGLLYQLGVDHPWVAQGAAYRWKKLEEGGLPADAHTLSEVLIFLEHGPERDRADDCAAGLAGQLATIRCSAWTLTHRATGFRRLTWRPWPAQGGALRTLTSCGRLSAKAQVIRH